MKNFTVVILFAVFAFLMQGRAHGAELYRVDVIKDAFCYADMTLMRTICRDEYLVENMRFTHKDTAYDLAFALNQAHRQRTKPVSRKKKQIPEPSDVTCFSNQPGYCDEQLAR